MKKYEFDISKYEINLFFPHERIKTKIQILEILMESVRFMHYSHNKTKQNKVGEVILFVDKMSRLFFFTKDKYYSTAFPFYVSESENKLSFSYKNEIEIDAKIISNILSVIKGKSFIYKSSIDFIDEIFDIEERINDNFWVLMKDIIMMEVGYIRYDKDEKNFDIAKEKGEEKKHPLFHYDFFYSNNVTVKIGLENKVLKDEFLDTLNINKDCDFIKK